MANTLNSDVVGLQDPPQLLIVDDSEINRHLLERLFTTRGFVAESAGTGVQALELIAQKNYDIVLMDIMMPEMDGIEALQQIRKSEDTASLPVILISAMSESGDIVRGLNFGANDYITKPIDMEIALARVQTHLTLKTLMDERARTIQQMEEVQEMREQFFRMASHDLKGPLSSMRVSHYLLERIVDMSDPRAQRVLSTLRATVDSMSEVVEDFLDQSTMQAGKLDIKIRSMKVVGLVRDVVTIQTPQAHEKNINIKVGKVQGTVLCDVARTQQIISNMVNNAVKYSPTGSTVSVWTKSVDGGVRISVQDEGPGIDEEDRVRLFQPFGKLSAQPTGGESSHGLGLWIAKHLTDLQHGEIGVDSPSESGSVFWLWLPSPEPATDEKD